MTKFKTHKKKGAAAIVTASVLALIALFGMTACSNAAQPGTGTGGSTALPEAPFVEGGASLILSPDKLDIKVRVRTADGSSVTVEGCEETTLTSGTKTVLHAKGTLVILKGKISKLDCGNSDHYENSNKLTDLNVQGLTALQELYCAYNRLTELNVQGLTYLRRLDCGVNRLTELNVQGLTDLRKLDCHCNQLTELNVHGCTALQGLFCRNNRLIELNVQDLTALQKLDCDKNQLTTLDVQGLTALQYLTCSDNQLTALDVQGLTALQGLFCYRNQLIEFNVQDLTALQYLRCADNQLTALNVQGLTALKGLSCYNNRLNADAFKKLFDDLPWCADSDGADCILYTEESGVTEGNHTNFTAPPELANAFNNAKTVKKWKMYKRIINSVEVEI